MIRNTALAGTLTLFVLTGTACNTVQGMGRDIESVGRKGEEVISYAPAPSAREDAQPAR